MAEWRGYTSLRDVTSPEGVDHPLGIPGFKGVPPLNTPAQRRLPLDSDAGRSCPATLTNRAPVGCAILADGHQWHTATATAEISCPFPRP